MINEEYGRNKQHVIAMNDSEEAISYN